MSDKRATSDDAGFIHGKLTAYFKDILENGEEVSQTDKETGEVTTRRVKPSPAMIAQIRTFLKDNNIMVMPGRSQPITDLSDAFEDFAPPTEPSHPSH